jgi:hypothetical protein
MESHWIHREVGIRLEPSGGSKARPFKERPGKGGSRKKAWKEVKRIAVDRIRWKQQELIKIISQMKKPN